MPQHFLWGNAEHNSLIIPAEINNFSNPFWRNSIEVSLQSKPFSIKLLPQSPFKKILFVERWNLSSNCLYSGSNENLAPSTNLAFVYHSSMPCRVHATHIQYFWYPQYWIFGFQATSISSFPLALIIHNVMENMLKKCCWSFLRILRKILKFRINLMNFVQ